MSHQRHLATSSDSRATSSDIYVASATSRVCTRQVVVPMPSVVQRVSCSYQAEPTPRGSQTWDWQEKQRRLVWKFKKVPGGTEHTLQVSHIQQ